MSILRRLFAPRPVSNPGRELAMIGARHRHDMRRAIVCAVAQRMRDELGMPPSPALNLQPPTTN